MLVANTEGDPKDWSKVGNRFPAVFYHGKKQQILVRHFLGKKEKNLSIKSSLAIDEPTSFKISQLMEDGKLMYKVNQLNQSHLLPLIFGAGIKVCIGLG